MGSRPREDTVRIALEADLAPDVANAVARGADEKYGVEIEQRPGPQALGFLEGPGGMALANLIVEAVGLLVVLWQSRRERQKEARLTKAKLLDRANEKMAEMGCLWPRFTEINGFAALKRGDGPATLIASDQDGTRYKMYFFRDGEAAVLRLL
jgi:hypothetical protein